MSYGRFRELVFPYQRPTNIGEFYVLNTHNGLTGNHVMVSDATAEGTIHSYQRCWDSVNPGPPYKTGTGMFISRLVKPLNLVGGGKIQSKPLTTGIPSSVQRKPGDKCVRVYSGSFSLGGVTHGHGNLGTIEGLPDPTVFNEVNPDDMSDLANRAYVKLRPKLEEAGVAQTLAEWRSMPGMLKTTSGGFSRLWKDFGGTISGNTMSPKAAASQFLNVVFGWQPFIKDVSDAYGVVNAFEDYIDRIKASNGSWLKRTRKEEVVESEEVLYEGQSNTNSCSPALQASEFLVPGSCYQTVTHQKLTRVWHTGTFKYYRPEFDYAHKMHPALRRVRQLITALGLRINPSVVYKVTPWTWLIDWFVNVGDFVTRVQDMADDSIMSREFYSMRHSVVRLEYRKRFSTMDGQSFDLKWYRYVETKRRGSAESPFHFTLLPSGLSARQIAILAAVGLTHS